MRKYLLLAVLLLLPTSGFAATVPFSTYIATTTSVGGSVPSGGLFSVTSGGHTYSALASQVGTGGGGGGSSGFDVTAAAYGAVCDGGIIPAGIATSSGSPDISIVNSPTNYIIGWTLQAGDLIVLSGPTAQLNTGIAPTSNQILTVLSATATTAHLNGNVNFTSTGYQQASARYYKTVNTTALQAALNAANATGVGGRITFPYGFCATGLLTFYGQETLSGQGAGNSGLMLANGQNSDLLVGYLFSSLTGTGGANSGGVTGFALEDIGLDGNKGANTGTGIGTSTGTGDLMRFWGASWYMNRVAFSNAAADDIYSEWSATPGDPTNGQFSLNDRASNLQFANQNGWAWVYNGPHDGYIENADITNCGTGGIVQLSGLASPLHITGAHSYQCSTSNGGVAGTGFDLDLISGVTVEQSEIEGTTRLNGESFKFLRDDLNILSIGANTTTDKVQSMLSSVTTLSVGTHATGFQDVWVGGIVGTMIGSTYAPDYSCDVAGDGAIQLGCRIGRYGSPVVFLNGASWPVTMQQSSTNVFTVTNGVIQGGAGVGITLGQNDRVSIGPTGATASSAVQATNTLDLWGGLGLVTTTAIIPVNGAYSPSANTLNLTTSGATALSISTTGNIGVGTTGAVDKLDVAGGLGLTTTSATLPINGMYSPSANALELTTSGANALFISTTGSVGVGTLTPTNKLTVNGGLALSTTTATVPANGVYLPVANTMALTTSGAINFEVNAVGHMIYAGTTPAVAAGAAACGTSPTIAGTDNQGVVVTGASPSGSCVVTFANAWTAAPDSCGCTDNTTGTQGCSALSISTTSFALTATTTPFVAADHLGYSCRSHQF